MDCFCICFVFGINGNQFVLLHSQKRYGKNQITDYIFERWGHEPEVPNEYIAPAVPVADEFTNKLLEQIWNVFGVYDGLELSKITHAKDGPWERVWKEAPEQNRPIPYNYIREHYATLANAADEELADEEQSAI